MITDCFGVRQWDFSDTETVFVQGVFALLKVLIPIAISVYTWKVSQTGRAHHRTSLLGLEKREGLDESEIVRRGDGVSVPGTHDHLHNSRVTGGGGNVNRSG